MKVENCLVKKLVNIPIDGEEYRLHLANSAEGCPYDENDHVTNRLLNRRFIMKDGDDKCVITNTGKNLLALWIAKWYSKEM